MRFPVGKLPAPLLAEILAKAPTADPDVLLGPGIGLDCAVIRFGSRLLVAKSDPVTFVSDELGHYLVSVNANDVATTGARPRWLLVTLLLPQDGTDSELPASLMDQIGRSCRELGITVVGGHTEITWGLTRPIAAGTLLGEVDRDRLVTPQGARPGDRVLLTKGVPIEGTAILGRELARELESEVGPEASSAARAFLHEPGISVVADARIAMSAGRVTAMHDPTEGGLVTALWELAQASGHRLKVDPAAVPVPKLSSQICAAFAMDPLATIASGALLLSVPPADTTAIIRALDKSGIVCKDIGEVHAGAVGVERLTESGYQTWSMPDQDELARMFESRGG